MHSHIRPRANIAIRLPSGITKILEIVPNTSISVGKFGSFPSNLLLGRPYYLTFEILGSEEGKQSTELRVVPAAELNAEALASDLGNGAESRDEPADGADGNEFDIVGENGEVIMRSNRLTIDDPSRQTLTMDEIEELKKAGTGSGKEIIAKIMASHMALDEKTSFSLAKYTLRKSKKYLKRFTVLPLTVNLLAQWIYEKESHRIMELRVESLGLIASWANVHYGGSNRVIPTDDNGGRIGGGRWLVVDDTGGLLLASLAERMGILFRNEDEEDDEQSAENSAEVQQQTEDKANAVEDVEMKDAGESAHASLENTKPKRRKHVHVPAMSADTNTLTLIHPSPQPNLGLLSNFGFDCTAPDESHPLYTHLKTISWLQLLHPEEDSGYQEPEIVPEAELETWKSSRRGTYYRKRRRWERVRRVVNETRAGGFDGLVVASTMDPKNILKYTVPLLRGGAQVAVYSPTVEPLTDLYDQFSRERRAAYIQRATDPSRDPDQPIDENLFPINPTLLLGTQLQTARARQYQVLPLRTHPMMTSRGGAEGYLFTATRVLPLEGKVEARGKYSKKKKIEISQSEEEAPSKKIKSGDAEQS